MQVGTAVTDAVDVTPADKGRRLDVSGDMGAEEMADGWQ
jgi:hypothetical protein